MPMLNVLDGSDCEVAGFVRLSNVGLSLLGLVRNWALSIRESEFKTGSVKKKKKRLLITLKLGYEKCG